MKDDKYASADTRRPLMCLLLFAPMIGFLFAAHHSMVTPHTNRTILPHLSGIKVMLIEASVRTSLV